MPALRRPARRGGDYERLEFLGDRVLGLVVAELLLARFPGEPRASWRGASPRWSARETLAEVAARDRARPPSRLSRGEAARPAARDNAQRCSPTPRGGDRGALSRWRAPAAARLHRAATGSALIEADLRAAARSQDRAAGMGAGPRPAAAGLRDGRDRGAGARAAFTVSVARRGLRAGERRAAAQARGRAAAAAGALLLPRDGVAGAGAERRRQAEPGAAPPLRLRRADRRAQCRQVDAGQPAGRRQGLDRHAQGADDARAACAASPSHGAAQIVFVDTPGIFAPQAAARPRDGRRPPGAAPRTPTSSLLLVDAAARHRRATPRRILDRAAPTSRAPRCSALNKIDLIQPRAAAGARRRAQRAGVVRRAPS